MEKQSRGSFLWIGDNDPPFKGAVIDGHTDNQQFSAILVSGRYDPSEAADHIRKLYGADTPWFAFTSGENAESWFDAGATGLISPETPPDVIIAALESYSRLLEVASTRNPLSGLPGNRTISARIRSDVIDGSSMAAYLDISGFKPFNDYYGFTRGDAVLRSLAGILTENLPDYFTGHIGGDDFICIGEGENFIASVRQAVKVFNSRAGGFYNGKDHAAGGIEALDRSGQFRFYPVMDLTLSLVSGKGCGTVEELALKAGLEKKRVKGEIPPGTVAGFLNELDDTPDYSDFREWVQNCEPDIVQIKALLESAGILGDRKMTGCMIEILQKEPDHHLRKSAARALGDVAGPDSARALKDALNDRSAHVRTAAATALPFVLGREAGEILKSILYDKSTWVRRAALRGLGISGWQDAAAILDRELRKPNKGGYWLNHQQELASTLEGITFLGDQKLIDAVIFILRKNPGVSKDLIWRSMLSLGGEKCVEEMLKTAEDGRHREYLPFLDRFDIHCVSRLTLEKLERVLTELDLKKKSDRISVLKFLRRIPGKVIHDISEWLLGLTDTLVDPDEFDLLLETMTAREVLPRGYDLARIVNRAKQGRLELTTKGIVSMLRWASTGKYTLSRTYIEKLLRHDSREIRTAAARTVVQLACKRRDELTINKE
ncbi:MAG: HEAT repeat domain-containing protein [Candidatus Aegiribacteria sp.]|nr:HEAT repeat domain-containing protein [Candidatus Aegiribacteria sp.]